MVFTAGGSWQANADSVRDSQWMLTEYRVETALWPVSRGDGVTVAVIDSGVMKDHPDLTGQVLPGADFSGESTDGTVDAIGHGTGMASLIAGHGHADKAGIVGIAPKARILPVRVKWGESGMAESAGLSQAIRYAVDHGAKVVNMSIGGYPGDDVATRAAVKYAIDKDVVLVASTGNGGDQLGPVEYPAAFPGVVAVGAVDRSGVLWGKSTYGPQTTLAAPGAEIPQASAKSSTGYVLASGTSPATAYVSATAALIRAKYPSLSAGQVINRMIKSASAPGDGSAVPSNRYGYGVLAPGKALEVNPAVDSGSRENPLVGRAESQGSVPPPSEETWESPEAAAPVADGGNRGVRWVAVGAAGVAGVVAVGGVVAVLVVRGRRRRERAAAAAYQGYPPPRQG
ncbi:type VII secretion-associated serine protease mycosin [Kitasatospora purpeofusca]|uniref:type VII secretion-associated serine protease mycosin n=1 Tax=Kitasatospora purpeofusca TaxID=67352 RepID=UPI0035DE3740